MGLIRSAFLIDAKSSYEVTKTKGVLNVRGIGGPLLPFLLTYRSGSLPYYKRGNYPPAGSRPAGGLLDNLLPLVENPCPPCPCLVFPQAARGRGGLVLFLSG